MTGVWIMILKTEESESVERSIQAKAKGGGESAPNRQARKKKKKRGVERTAQGTEIKGRIGPLAWDDWGLLPDDGLGRLSADDY